MLQDERMESAWPQLAKRVEKDADWQKVWGAIVCAYGESKKSKKRKLRTDSRDEYQALARKFSALAKKIENGRLDVPAYELLPQDVCNALHIPDFHTLDDLTRAAVAHDLLIEWPTASELLCGLGSCAQRLADEAMKEYRPGDRVGKKLAARLFVAYLGKQFKYLFKEPLLGTIAKITNVALDPDEKLEYAYDRGFVQSVLKRTPKAA